MDRQVTPERIAKLITDIRYNNGKLLIEEEVPELPEPKPESSPDDIQTLYNAVYVLENIIENPVGKYNDLIQGQANYALGSLNELINNMTHEQSPEELAAQETAAEADDEADEYFRNLRQTQSPQEIRQKFSQ